MECESRERNGIGKTAVRESWNEGGGWGQARPATHRDLCPFWQACNSVGVVLKRAGATWSHNGQKGKAQKKCTKIQKFGWL